MDSRGNVSQSHICCGKECLLVVSSYILAVELDLSASCEVHGRNVPCVAVGYWDSGTPQPPKECAVTSAWIRTFLWAISYILVAIPKFLRFLIEAQNGWVPTASMVWFSVVPCLFLGWGVAVRSSPTAVAVPLFCLNCLLAQRSEAWGELVWWRMAVSVDGLQGCLSRVHLCLCYSCTERVARILKPVLIVSE